MKLFVLWWHNLQDYYQKDCEFCGVFDSQEKATAEIPNQVAIGRKGKLDGEGKEFIDTELYYSITVEDLNVANRNFP